MAKWISQLSEKFSGKKQIPLPELLPTLLDEGDLRTVFRPLGNDWLCPFSGKVLQLPEWDGSSATLLDLPAVVEHLLQLPVLQQLREKAQMLPWEVLLQKTVAIRLDAQKNEFTQERLKQVLAECNNLSAQDAILYLLSAVREHTGQIAMEDDLAVVAVRRLPIDAA